MLCLVQTVHLSCTDTNTLTKWIKTRFHITHVTFQFHRVRPKWFLRLWYFRHKPCAYLASRLALSPNELNGASTGASLPRSTIGFVQNDFWAWGTFGANQAPKLHQHQHYLQMGQNESPHDPHHLVVPSGAYITISEPLVRSTQTVHLSCVKISTYLQTNRIEIPLETRHLGVPPGASKMISKPMVCLAQTALLTCTNTSTVSQWTKTRFDKTHVT
jgi:hypothetical protein